MALNLKTSPAGIDVEIQYIQEKVYANLLGFGWGNYESYGRAYKNNTKNGKIAEVYTGNGEYEEVYFNDNFTATSFFLVGDSIGLGQVHEASVSMIFQVNLSKIYDEIAHRADEEVHEDVRFALLNNVKVSDLSAQVTGLESVYGELFNNSLKFDDMSDCHVFKFDFTVRYSNACRKREVIDFIQLENECFILYELAGDKILIE